MAKARPQRIISAPKEIPLFVLGGFPKPVDNAVRVHLKERWPTYRFIAVPFPRESAELYPKRAVRLLLRAAAGFVLRRHVTSGTEEEVVPNRFYLIYISNSDEEQLLTEFDFFALPVALEREGPWRFDFETAYDKVAPVVETIARRTQHVEDELQRRDKSPLMLPPRNFLLDSQGRTPLAAIFADLRKGISNVHHAVAKVKPRKFLWENLPKALGLRPRAYFFEDARGLVFPPALPEQYHGLSRVLPNDAPDEEIKLTLNTLYRFGVPIAHGFHNDVQRINGVLLHNLSLTCSREGPVLVSGAHARIYPNDYIIADDVRKPRAPKPKIK